MHFSIGCETVKRLNNIAGPDHRMIRIEHIRSATIAIVTNRKLAVVEKIGVNHTGLAGAVHVPLTDALVAQCVLEAAFKGSLAIEVNEVLQYAVAKTTLGWQYQGNAMVTGTSKANTDLNDWREWLPPAKTKTNGALFLNTEQMTQLLGASPSGRVVFPEHIDTSKPVVIRDVIDDNWFGLFMANRVLSNGTIEQPAPAVVPKWIEV